MSYCTGVYYMFRHFFQILGIYYQNFTVKLHELLYWSLYFFTYLLIFTVKLHEFTVLNRGSKTDARFAEKMPMKLT